MRVDLLDIITHFITVISHLDQYLDQFILNYGLWTYALLFLIIFCETGLVVTPFLPGDSLLFIAGSLASREVLNAHVLVVLLILAAIIGDTLNYWIGYYAGRKAFERENSRIFRQEYLRYTQSFYERYGGKTIVLARFIPIVRTFAPFVAGVGRMKYAWFLCYNILGGIAWISLLIYLGFFFGNIPLVKQHYTWVILGIIILSVMPGVVEFLRHKYSQAKVN